MKIRLNFLLIACGLFVSFQHAFAQDLTFTTNTLKVGSGPECVIAADVNGDGKLDLISANYQSQHADGADEQWQRRFWLQCHAQRGQSSRLRRGGGCQRRRQAGFDQCELRVDNTLTVLTNNGSGGFGSNATLNVGNGPICVVAADVNGDGKLDLISANYRRQHADGADEQWQWRLWLQCHAQRGHRAECVVAADVNGDGKLDLISANYEWQHADGADQQWQWRLWLQCHTQRGERTAMRRGGGCQRRWQTGFDQRESTGTTR